MRPSGEEDDFDVEKVVINLIEAIEKEKVDYELIKKAMVLCRKSPIPDFQY